MSSEEPDNDRKGAAPSVARWLEQSARSDQANRSRSRGTQSPLFEAGPVLRDEAAHAAVQLLVVERCSLAASAGLINAASSQDTKLFLATQVLDAARHIEALTDRLVSLGVDRNELDRFVVSGANPDLLSLAETALRPINKGDFIVGLLGQNVVLTEIMLAAYELLEAFNRVIDPDFADALESMIADERRHLEFGCEALGRMVARHPEKKTEIVHLATEISRHMIHAFAGLFRDNPTADELRRLQSNSAHTFELRWQGVDLVGAAPATLEQTIIDLIARRLKKRLGRLGMGYRTPTPLETR